MLTLNHRTVSALPHRKKLGHGLSRTTYALPGSHDVVIKVEDWFTWSDQPDRSYNRQEWDIWHATADRPNLRKWLARPLYISPDNTVLIQERADEPNAYHLDPTDYQHQLRSLRRSLKAQGLNPNSCDLHTGNVLPKADAPNGHGIIIVDYASYEFSFAVL